MKHTFSIILVVCLLMVIGAALVPSLDISNKPRPEQGKTLTISYRWPSAPAKVVEQNVTSRIEALVSSVKGVKKVSSVSKFGGGTITVELKPKTNVSQIRFEIAQIIRHVRTKLPSEMTYPVINGGETNAEEGDNGEVKHVLTWQMYADMSDEQLHEILKRTVKRVLEHTESVHHVEITGESERYMEISYDAEELASYGLTGADVAEAVRNYGGRDYVVGIVTEDNGITSVPLILSSAGQKRKLEEIPLTSVGDKIVYVNNLVSCKIRNRQPDSYYRVNGMNTVYIKVFINRDAKVVSTTKRIKSSFDDKRVQEILSGKNPVKSVLIYDRADEEMKEFNTLVWRTGLTLLILIVFVWISGGGSWKYLFIVAVSLLANILLAVILYYLSDVRLHPVSMAGITVSLGLIIDSTIVMTDHYSYSRDRKAFWGILGAMLTTVGAMSVVGWLPDFLRRDLLDFAVVMGINLIVAVFVAMYFVPALVCQTGYNSRVSVLQRTWHTKLAVRILRLYRRYVYVSQHRVIRWALLVVVMVCFAFTLKMFVESLLTNSYHPKEEKMTLNIRGQMPVGGSVQELNDKVKQVESFLTTFNGIKNFETMISQRGAHIHIEFTDSALNTSFPYMLENRVIGKVITIGGADWATWGVSERGFSNSLNLQYRTNGLDLTGYDYDRLYRYAEDLCKEMRKNNRVVDLAIVTPGHEEQEDEVYVEYDKLRLSLDSIKPQTLHSVLRSILTQTETGVQLDGLKAVVVPTGADRFDLWNIRNSHVDVNGANVPPSGYMDINMREAKNVIPRENQEYTLRVAFNILGSYTYSERYLKRLTTQFSGQLPIGFKCKKKNGWEEDEDEGMQYWLVGLIVVIIFFVLAVMLESLYQAMVLTLLIPLSFIGLFLSYVVTETPFGTGGFAAMVLLAGLAVNAGIYILFDYRMCNRYGINGYLTAVKHKFMPVMLTTLSTILGMLPFICDGYDEQPFWYSLAVGTTGGLLIGTTEVFFILPIFLKIRNKV